MNTLYVCKKGGADSNVRGEAIAEARRQPEAQPQSLQ